VHLPVVVVDYDVAASVVDEPDGDVGEPADVDELGVAPTAVAHPSSQPPEITAPASR
jgi:hypothetical protein